MPLPASFLTHLRVNGYHPRSNKHSDALAEAIVVDLIATCEPLAQRAKSGAIVYDLNFDLITGTSTWNVDLVVGQAAPGTPPPTASLLQAHPPIRKASPSTVQIATEMKAVMTEHRKAVKNRKRDLEAHHEHVHNYSANAIAAGVMLFNISGTFDSPTRDQSDITTHRDPVGKVTHCMSELRAVSMRGGPTGYGLDAKTGIVVEMDNINWPSTRYYEKPPAPQVGDPLHYDAFIQRLCAEYAARYP